MKGVEVRKFYYGLWQDNAPPKSQVPGLGRRLLSPAHVCEVTQQWLLDQQAKLQQSISTVHQVNPIPSTTPVDLLSLLPADSLKELQAEILRCGGLGLDAFCDTFLRLLEQGLCMLLAGMHWVLHLGQSRQLTDEDRDALQDTLPLVCRMLDVNNSGDVTWDEVEWALLNAFAKEDSQTTLFRQHKPLPYEVDLNARTFVQPLPDIEALLIGNCASSTLQRSSTCTNLHSWAGSAISRRKIGSLQQSEIFQGSGYLASQRKLFLLSSQTLQVCEVNSTINQPYYKSFHPSTTMLHEYIFEGHHRHLLLDEAANAMYSTVADGIVVSYPIPTPESGHFLYPHLQVKAHSESITGIVAVKDPPPPRLACGSMDTFISIIDVEKEKVLQMLGDTEPSHRRHTEGVVSLDYSPDHSYLVSAGLSPEPIMWNPSTGGPNRYLGKLVDHDRSHGQLVQVMCIHGTFEVVTADIHGLLKVWDIRMTKVLQNVSLVPSSRQSKLDFRLLN
eukprot:gene3493-3952_t